MTGERLRRCPVCFADTVEDAEVHRDRCTTCNAVWHWRYSNSARSLPAALDRVIAEVEARVPRNRLDHAETVQCLALLRALRAKHSAEKHEGYDDASTY